MHITRFQLEQKVKENILRKDGTGVLLVPIKHNFRIWKIVMGIERKDWKTKSNRVMLNVILGGGFQITWS